MATCEEADRTLVILRDPRRRHAMQAMIMRAVPQTRGHPDWKKIEELVSRYGDIRKPCLIIWGGRDELFPESMGHRLANLIQNARLRIVVSAKHCLPTEHPQVSFDLIQGFVAGVDGQDKIVYLDPPLRRSSPVVSLAELRMRTLSTATAGGNADSAHPRAITQGLLANLIADIANNTFATILRRLSKQGVLVNARPKAALPRHRSSMLSQEAEALYARALEATEKVTGRDSATRLLIRFSGGRLQSVEETVLREHN